MSAVEGGLDDHTYCLTGGFLDMRETEADQIGIIKSPAMCEEKSAHEMKLLVPW